MLITVILITGISVAKAVYDMVGDTSEIDKQILDLERKKANWWTYTKMTVRYILLSAFVILVIYLGYKIMSLFSFLINLFGISDTSTASFFIKIIAFLVTCVFFLYFFAKSGFFDDEINTDKNKNNNSNNFQKLGVLSTLVSAIFMYALFWTTVMGGGVAIYKVNVWAISEFLVIIKDDEKDNNEKNSIPKTNETTDIQQNDTTCVRINKENEKKSILTVINGRWVIIEPTDSL